MAGYGGRKGGGAKSRSAGGGGGSLTAEDPAKLRDIANRKQVRTTQTEAELNFGSTMTARGYRTLNSDRDLLFGTYAANDGDISTNRASNVVNLTRNALNRRRPRKSTYSDDTIRAFAR